MEAVAAAGRQPKRLFQVRIVVTRTPVSAAMAVTGRAVSRMAASTAPRIDATIGTSFAIAASLATHTS